MQISETSLVSGCMCLSSVTTASSQPTWLSLRRADVNTGGEDWGQSSRRLFKVAQLWGCLPHMSSQSVIIIRGLDIAEQHEG